MYNIYTRSIYVILMICFYTQHVNAQTNSATITESGWYRIAINGPLVDGQTGGNRAAARFILRDPTSSLHQMVEFLGYEHYGKRPSIVVLNNSYFGGTPPFMKIRIITGGTYEGSAIDVYVYAKNSNHETCFIQDNDQISGWSAVNWQQVTTLPENDAGVPAGFNVYVINLKNMVKGFVGSRGKQITYTNGNLYTSGNVLIGKETQSNSSYKLDVNGNIRADKVVVNTTGADYVFDSAFQMFPLDSLDGYIERYHHLPGIPSARKMKKEGLGLGDAYIMLLQKIEVMSKYIIEMRKTIRKQQQEFDKLKHSMK